jgi:2-keto-4-pentenoate hydratase
MKLQRGCSARMRSTSATVQMTSALIAGPSLSMPRNAAEVTATARAQTGTPIQKGALIVAGSRARIMVLTSSRAKKKTISRITGQPPSRLGSAPAARASPNHTQFCSK